MNAVIALPIILTFIGIMIFPIWKSETPNSLKDFTIGQIILTIPILPGIIISAFFCKYLLGLLRSKPFKKARFQVGEEVFFNGTTYVVVKNEKEMDGDCLSIRQGFMQFTVKTKEVTKLTKVDKLLK